MARTVLITGASRGIGFALTDLFLQNGYHVIGTSRDGKIDDLSHPNLEVIKLDLSDLSAIKSVGKSLAQDHKNIDILINNAGIAPDLDYNLPEEETFKQTIDVNVTGTVFLTESLIGSLSDGGIIINISSDMGSIESCDLADAVAYRMSKSALNMYTKILSNRLIDTQRVASVHPGWVRTTISKDNIINGRLSPEESARKIFDFTVSDFKSGIYWHAEWQSEMEW